LGIPSGRAAKVIDGHHPGQLQAGGSATMPKPDMLPLPEGDDAKNPNCKRNILVAVTGDELDTELVTMAANIAKMKKANVYAVFGIEVPRKLAVDAEMPDESQAADDALQVARALADQMHVHLEPEIVQSRHLGPSLVEESKAHDCSLVILGLPYHVGVGGHFELSEMAEYVLKNAPCRVWLVRGQPVEMAEAKESRDAVGVGR